MTVAGHECWCGACNRAGVAVPLRRSGFGHVAARLRDVQPRLQVIIDGEDVTERCAEANAQLGYVLLYRAVQQLPTGRWLAHSCGYCGGGPCLEYRTGMVHMVALN